MTFMHDSPAPEYPAALFVPPEFTRMMDRGSARCRDLADSERILGYRYNYRVYQEMAEEFKGLPIWVRQEMTSRRGGGV